MNNNAKSNKNTEKNVFTPWLLLDELILLFDPIFPSNNVFTK